MFLDQITVGPMKNFSYLVGDEQTGEAFVVDPAFDPERILTQARRRGANITRIVLTHTHSDHINAVPQVKAATGARVIAHRLAATKGAVALDEPVEDGDGFALGETDIRVLHTPGHTPEGICLQIGTQWLITGDTLFVGDCGRADLPGGSIEELFASLQKLKALPGELLVYPGHGYGPQPYRSLAEELRLNPTLKAATLKEFSAIP